MTHRHTPHTSKWFEAVMRDDPESAAHTASVIKHTGREDVCGVCGDHPTTDYEARGAEMSDGSTPTMRLCVDCVGFQRANGLNLVEIV